MSSFLVFTEIHDKKVFTKCLAYVCFFAKLISERKELKSKEVI